MTLVQVRRHFVIAVLVSVSCTLVAALVGVVLSSGVLPKHSLLNRAMAITDGTELTGPEWTSPLDTLVRTRGYAWETVALYYNLSTQTGSPSGGDDSLPRWSRLRALHDEYGTDIANETDRGFIEERAYGWPAACLRAWSANSNAFNRPLDHASLDVGGLFKHDLEYLADVMDYRWTPLPYIVIPSGAIANIVFWSVLWLAVASVGRRVWHRLGPIVCRRYREQIRADGELCIHCGYSLAGVGTSRCPECGRARSTAIAGSTE